MPAVGSTSPPNRGSQPFFLVSAEKSKSDIGSKNDHFLCIFRLFCISARKVDLRLQSMGWRGWGVGTIPTNHRVPTALVPPGEGMKDMKNSKYAKIGQRGQKNKTFVEKFRRRG